MEAIDITTPAQLSAILTLIRNPKHRIIVLLMYDAGLRVSEVLGLEWTDLDFRRRTIRVCSLKKRNLEKPRAEREHRPIPMSDRIYAAFAEYLDGLGERKHKLAFTNASGGKMFRTSINNMLKHIQHEHPELGNLHPHKLRHSFATNLRAQGAELADIRDLLGHSRLDTTLIYAHADPARLQALIEASQPKPTFWQRLRLKIVPPKRHKVSLMQTGTDATFGRDEDTQRIAAMLAKNISVLLTGPPGIGKSHLLNRLQPARPVLTLDDTRSMKQSVAGILLHLFQGDKEAVAELIYDTREAAALETKITKESLPNLCRVLVSATARHEYILKIDNLDDITPTAVKALEMLKDHFVILTSARRVKMDKTGFLWNFEKLELAPLNRAESLRMIHHLNQGLATKDASFRFYQKIHDTADGNPRMMLELCDRLHKEPVLDPETIVQVCDNYLGRQVKELDMSPYFLVAFGAFAILRYVGRESNESALQFVGGAIMIVLLFARYFFSATRRKFI